MGQGHPYDFEYSLTIELARRTLGIWGAMSSVGTNLVAKSEGLYIQILKKINAQSLL